MFSRAEIAGGVIAVLMVAVMGVIVRVGTVPNSPLHKINKPVKVSTAFAPLTLKIVTDPHTIGRYVPPTVTVHVGQKVTWNNVSNADHTVTAKNRVFDSLNIGVGSSWTYIPSKPGVFKYVCIYHPLMLGTLVVKP